MGRNRRKTPYKNHPPAREVLTGGTPVDTSLYESYEGYDGPVYRCDYYPNNEGRYLYPTTSDPKQNLTYTRGLIPEKEDDPILYFRFKLGHPVGDLTWQEFISLYITISRLAVIPSSPLAPYFSESEMDRKMEIYNALAASLLHAKYDKREEHERRVKRAKRREPHKVVVFNKHTKRANREER